MCLSIMLYNLISFINNVIVFVMSGVVYEDGTTSLYQSMKFYTDKLKSIANSPGFFVNNYKQVQQQLNEINAMKERHKAISMNSIKKDIIDYMVKTVDWKKLQNDLKDFIKSLSKKGSNKQIINIDNFKQFKFKYNDNWDNLNDEYLNNMFLYVSDIDNVSDNIDVNTLNAHDKKNIKLYLDTKNILFNEFNTFLNNVNIWEDALVRCRNNNYPILMHNVKCLYDIHKKYVYEKYNKIKSSFEREVNGNVIDCVVYKTNKKDIILPLDNSQSTFIKNSIKLMLDLD